MWMSMWTYPFINVEMNVDMDMDVDVDMDMDIDVDMDICIQRSEGARDGRDGSARDGRGGLGRQKQEELLQTSRGHRTIRSKRSFAVLRHI
jgi:hypothetical protein